MAVTKMLLGITIKFLLCYSLPTSLNIWETRNFLNGDEPSLVFRYFVDISNLLVILNSATNSLFVIRFHQKKKKKGLRSPSGSTRKSISFARLINFPHALLIG